MLEPRSRGVLDARIKRGMTAEGLIHIRELAQRRAKDLAGFADQRGAGHGRRGVGEGAGDADADRGRPAEQGIVAMTRARCGAAPAPRP